MSFVNTYYSRAISIAPVASDSPYVQVFGFSGAVAPLPGIIEMGVELVDGTETHIQLAVVDASGGAPTFAASTSLVAESKALENTNYANAGQVLVTAWTAAPVKGNVLRDVVLTSKGSNVTWTWSEDHPLGWNQELVLWNAGTGTGGTLKVYVKANLKGST